MSFAEKDEIEIDSYSKEISLTGQGASLTVSISLAKSQSGPRVSDDAPGYLSVTMRFREDNVNEILTLEQRKSIRSDTVYDLLDASICLAHFADREDTTETLEDMIRETVDIPSAIQGSHKYSHTCQWAIFQSFCGTELLLHSKTNRYFQNQRFITILFHPDENDVRQTTTRLIRCSPQDVTRFSTEMYACYYSIQKLIWSTEDPQW